jgi:hypothetical protein
LATPGGAELHVAADATRDQSYFLFATLQEQLDFLRELGCDEIQGFLVSRPLPPAELDLPRLAAVDIDAGRLGRQTH